MVIQDLLRAWGANQAINRPPNDYPKNPLGQYSRSPGQAGPRLPSISDDAREKVEAAVNVLRQRKRKHYDVICLAYIYGIKDADIGRANRASRSWARELRVSAEHWIEARVEP